MVDRIRFARYKGETARIIFAPFYIGLARHYFDEVNVQVEVLEPEEQPWVTVSEGRADIGAGFIDYCVDPEFHGHMIAGVLHEQFRPGHGLTILLGRRQLIASGELNGYETLAGKRVALLSKRGDDYLAILGALQQGGLSIHDVEVVSVPHSGRARIAAAAEGKVDVIIGRRPRHVIDDIGTGYLVPWKSGYETHPGLQARYLLLNSRYLQEHRSVAVRFIQAYLRGARDYCTAHNSGRDLPDFWRFLSQITGETPLLLSTMKPIGFAPNGKADPTRLARELEWLAERELVPENTRVEDVWDSSLVDEALETIGQFSL